MSTMTPLFSAAECPLCSQPNQCAMAQGDAPAQCWCMAAAVAPEALAALPPDARGQRCICPACARGASSASDD